MCCGLLGCLKYVLYVRYPPAGTDAIPGTYIHYITVCKFKIGVLRYEKSLRRKKETQSLFFDNGCVVPRTRVRTI